MRVAMFFTLKTISEKLFNSSRNWPKKWMTLKVSVHHVFSHSFVLYASLTPSTHPIPSFPPRASLSPLLSLSVSHFLVLFPINFLEEVNRDEGKTMGKVRKYCSDSLFELHKFWLF